MQRYVSFDTTIPQQCNPFVGFNIHIQRYLSDPPTTSGLDKPSQMTPNKLIVIILSSFLLTGYGPSAIGVEQPSQWLTSVRLQPLTGGVMYVRAVVNGYPDSLNFILDTGSGGISLDSATCARWKMPIRPSDKTIRGIAGVRKVSFLYGARLNLPGLSVDSLDFHVNDYEILSSVYGIRVDGIIGYSFFSRYIVRLDYDMMQMDVFTQGEYLYPKGGHTLRPLLTNIPIQTGSVHDAHWLTSRFYFDTGAGLALLLSESFVRDSSVLAIKKKAPLVTQAEGVGGKMTMRITTIRKFRLGPYSFRKVPTFLFEDPYNITNYPFLGGLIGNDILRRFNTVINYAKREIHIIPNKHLRDPFDYSYTGLGIYQVDGRVVVEDVLPGSPGEQAGFRTGDMILAINNDISGNIRIYKELLQQTGTKLRFLVRNEDGIRVLTMRPARIY
jgi:hypothetical protein